MKIVFAVPPSSASYPVLPVGLASLAAVLRNHGSEVRIIDAWAEGYSYDELGETVAQQSPDVVGISMNTPLFEEAHKTVDAISKFCDTCIIAGGPHPSALPEICLNENPNIDYVVIGEGENVIIPLLEKTGRINPDLYSLKGIAFRNNGRIVNTGPADLIHDLDSLPTPAYDLFPFDKYKTHPPYGRKQPYATLVTSRGCPYPCTYCSKSVSGNTYRSMSARKVVDQIQYMKTTYGIKELRFYDDNFTFDQNRVSEICDMIIAENISLQWSCSTRIDLVSRQLIQKMRNAGCWMITYGVETGSPEIMKRVNRVYTIENVKHTFSLTKQSNIKTTAFFQVGLPGETKETFRASLDLSLELNPDFVSWCITVLYPGSIIYNKMKQNMHDNYVPGYSRKDNYNSGARSPFGQGNSIVCSGNLSYEELKQCIALALKKFYLRPSKLVQLMLGIRSFHELVHYCKGGIKTSAWVFHMLKTKLRNR